MAMPWLTLLALVWLGACSPSTVFVQTFRPPTAEPLDLKGDRVVAMVLMADPEKRAHAEDALAREITKRGAIGIPMHKLLPNTDARDEAAARKAVEASGAKGIIAMRPRRAQKKVVTPEQSYYGSSYGGFWGGYYPYGWGAPYVGSYAGYGHGSSYVVAEAPTRTPHGLDTVQYIEQPIVVPEHTEVYDTVRVEIVIYSLKQNQLVWVGETETVDPSDVDSFVEELVEGTAEELKRLYLVPS
jgi:hypothetical protein